MERRPRQFLRWLSCLDLPSQDFAYEQIVIFSEASRLRLLLDNVHAHG